jgi:NarL family two-component system response regulator LiaR
MHFLPNLPTLGEKISWLWGWFPMNLQAVSVNETKTDPLAHAEGIRVFIADDHDVVREGLVGFIRMFDDIVLVGEASDGAEAIERCRRLNPDIVLMDLAMPGTDGVFATRAIRASNPATQIIVLTSFNQDDLVADAIQAGAIGYLLKSVRVDVLAAAIRAAAAGKPTLSVEATQALMRKATQPLPLGHDLTERESEVLQMMTKGKNNVAIAEQLFLSPHTVKHHVSNVLSKLGVATRSEAISVALEHRIVR